MGRATAEGLAKMGASLVLVGGDRVQLSSAAERVKRDFPDTMLKTLVADLSSMMEVRRSASEIMSEQHRIDVLINNVGTAAQIREVTVDGYERTFALGHLAPFLLTNLLLASLRSSAPSRIITVSSSSYPAGSLNLDDLMLERGYSTYRACGQAKLANTFTCELAQRLQGTGVTANFVASGRGEQGSGSKLVGRTFGHGGRTPFELSWMSKNNIYLPPPRGRGFDRSVLTGMRLRRPARASYDREAARMLWEVSERLTGLRTG